MKKQTPAVTFFACFVFFMLCHDAFAEKEEFSFGPLSIRNEMPLYAFYMQMLPERAEVIERKQSMIDARYTLSNITVSCFTPTGSIDLLPLYDVQIDMEISRFTMDWRYGIYDNCEVGVEVPYISFSQGYADSFIEGFEDAIQARTPRSRERQGSYNFEYTFKYQNRNLIELNNSAEGIGDIILHAKYQIIREEEHASLPNISVRAGVKLPTAEKEKYLGSGKTDVGAGFLLDKCFFDRLFVYLGGNAVRIGKPDVFNDLGIKEYIYSWVFACEYFLNHRCSLVLQTSGNTTPYPYSQTNALDNDANEIILGLNYNLKSKPCVSWNFAVVENIGAASSPDVTFHTGVKWKY